MWLDPRLLFRVLTISFIVQNAIAGLLPPNFRAAGSMSLVPVTQNSALSQSEGIVLVAGTNDRLSLRSDFTLHYTKEPIDYPYRPSVNVFFKSFAQYWNHKATAVLYQLP